MYSISLELFIACMARRGVACFSCGIIWSSMSLSPPSESPPAISLIDFLQMLNTWSSLSSVPPTCSASFHFICINASGLVRYHHTVNSRCPGSLQVPLVGVCTSQPCKAQHQCSPSPQSVRSSSLSACLSISLLSRNRCVIVRRIMKSCVDQRPRFLRWSPPFRYPLP